jgi:hypothetical protein
MKFDTWKLDEETYMVYFEDLEKLDKIKTLSITAKPATYHEQNTLIAYQVIVPNKNISKVRKLLK